MPNQQSLNTPGRDIEAWERLNLTLYVVPIRLRIDKQAPFFGIDGDYHLTVAVIEQLVPIAYGDSDATFRIDINVVYTPKHGFIFIPLTAKWGLCIRTSAQFAPIYLCLIKVFFEEPLIVID
jgi:hypothetical protein